MIVLLAASVDPSLLAPGPQELARSTAEMRARVDRADAIETALGRVQNAIGEAIAAKTWPDPCADAGAGALVARARAFGAAYRDAVQSARAELDRLERLWVAPTIVPLLDDDDRAGATDLRRRTDAHVRAYLEALAWETKVVEPTARACPAIPLAAVAGVAYPGAPALGEDRRPIAVLGTGGGFVCPAHEPADGRVLVLTDGLGCWAESDCTCELAPLLPGAVVAPKSP